MNPGNHETGLLINIKPLIMYQNLFYLTVSIAMAITTGLSIFLSVLIYRKNFPGRRKIIKQIRINKEIQELFRRQHKDKHDFRSLRLLVNKALLHYKYFTGIDNISIASEQIQEDEENTGIPYQRI
jgi:hypothetical protein